MHLSFYLSFLVGKEGNYHDDDVENVEGFGADGERP